ncbi:hypothetical protein PHLGIDRAFT_368206 [Phlebiopsis gigantea 11061_1 CR5-6]|uniref:Uncharacterized protein n=1 Tax=Phlebiopsis gigantea (strain 11061_1 CR5-6) TaxID=745531 RepID=A0A0C3SDS4_PHLG1|nr:hypothetical protein PHLGIDRAFT_368206 [Phlebiopsis gigantea 11061_1 CR5-6]
MAIGTAFFAGVVGTFYYSRSWAHNKDDQTWIVRHGQQPNSPNGWVHHDMSGPRLVHTRASTEPANLLAHVPLRGNSDNRGSESVLGRVMSVIAGRGLFPDGLSPVNPTNKQVPVMQRQNDAGTHFYTKVRNITSYANLTLEFHV